MRADKLARLRQRRTDALIKSQAGVTEAYTRLAEDDSVKYAIGAMQPIDPDYTANTIAEGDRVCAQLRTGLKSAGFGVDYRYQGSVTNDTHIRAHSDIDLLTIDTAFFSLEPPLTPSTPYQGDWAQELQKLRTEAARILRAAYPAAKVDDSGGKCIALLGGSLRRKIDVVIANWWDTVDFTHTRHEAFRGVKVFDAKTRNRIENKPFLHNARIDERDRRFDGSVRKVARLLKSLKYDAEPTLTISSYDVVSIAYRMPDSSLAIQRGYDLQLVSNAEAFLRRLLDNPQERNALRVPNELRTIFGTHGATETGLRALHSEVISLVRDIEQGLSRSFKRLNEARILY